MKHTQFMILCWAASICTVHAQGVRFESDLSWVQIKEKAKAANQYIMLDAYTTWCGPCKQMSREVFPQQEAGDFFNGKFITVKVQMDQTPNDNEAVKRWYKDAEMLTRACRIGAYPTILFFAPDGDLTHKVEGFRDVKQLIADANTAIENSEAFMAQYNRFKKGEKDTAFIKQLATRAEKTGRTEKAHEIAQVFLNGLSTEDVMTKENLRFAYMFTTAAKDRCFNIFLKQAKKVNKVFEIDGMAERKVRSIVSKEDVEPYLSGSIEPDWDIIEKRIKAKYGAIGLEGYYGDRMIYASDRQDWKNFGKYYALYFSTAYSRSKFHINNISWSVFEHVEDPKVLEVAIKAMKYNLEHYDKKDPNSYDTYANLLYKAGHKQEALKWQQDAVALDKEAAVRQNRQPNQELVASLIKMQAGKPTWK